eukprot:GHVS01067660.1.p1 GENE.GHVS01067660.1~~GHVS01067660.1.p1  ORF type:complete len:453 (-),score=19.85 GHVS01067660.1:479-1837(-)
MGFLPQLESKILADPEQWFLKFEYLMENQNVHPGEYVTCLLNNGQKHFSEDIHRKIDPVKLKDHTSVRKFIADIYGPRYLLTLYTKELLALPSKKLSVGAMIAAINHCCDNYKRAYERQHHMNAGKAELDEELCFTTLVDYLQTQAANLVVGLQHLFEQQRKTFSVLTTYLQAEEMRDPELCRLNQVYTATHNDYATCVSFVSSDGGYGTPTTADHAQGKQKVKHLATNVRGRGNNRYVNKGLRQRSSGRNEQGTIDHPRAQQSESRECSYCKKVGHIQRFCPERKDQLIKDGILVPYSNRGRGGERGNRGNGRAFGFRRGRGRGAAVSYHPAQGVNTIQLSTPQPPQSYQLSPYPPYPGTKATPMYFTSSPPSGASNTAPPPATYPANCRVPPIPQPPAETRMINTAYNVTASLPCDPQSAITGSINIEGEHTDYFSHPMLCGRYRTDYWD